MITFIEPILICMGFTLVGYSFGLIIQNKFKKNWLNPIYTSSMLIISLLFVFHIHVETYQKGSSVFNPLLQMAVVSLAIPLYKQWDYLKRNFMKISVGVLTGSLLGIFSVLLMAKMFHLNQILLASLIPKSVTLPIALTVSTDLGGISSFTVVFVILSGIFSLILDPNLFERIGINSKAAKGLAMGTAAQMLGASRSLHWGEEEGAMGSVAMTSTAILFSVLIPILPFLFQR